MGHGRKANFALQKSLEENDMARQTRRKYLQMFVYKVYLRKN